MLDYPFYDKQPGPERREKLNELYATWESAISNVFKGDSGWSPLIRAVTSGNKTALQLYDWTGGQGVKPTTTGYLGTAGYVANIADAVDFRGPQGLQGPQGLKGDTGTAATISIGTTSTSAPGSSATVSNSGSSSAAVLNFSIPQGEQGPAGTVAVGTVVSGAPGSNAQVTNSGSAQAAVLNFVIPRGDKGDQGAQGQAATIAVGTVATGDAGTSASVTNSGTQNAATFDFIIPRGDKGDQGIQGAKGDTGSKGDKGDKGDAATISVGTVTTGAQGTQVQVVNSGTTSAAVFDFTIPRGADGSGTGDMLKSEYDTVGDGVVNASRSTPWNGVTDKPAVIAAGADQATARLSINAAAADHTHSATDISFTPIGNVIATNVQAAIAELDSDLTTALGDINAALIAING